MNSRDDNYSVFILSQLRELHAITVS